MCYSLESIYVINVGSKLKEGGGGELLKRSAAILNTYIMAFEKAGWCLDHSPFFSTPMHIEQIKGVP